MTPADEVLTVGQFSPITEAALRLFAVLRWLSPMHWLSRFVPALKPRNAVTPDEAASLQYMRRRAPAVEYYIIVWLMLEALLVACVCTALLAPWVRVVMVVLALVRVVEILQVTVNATVFDQLSGRADNRIASAARMLVLAFVNFLELCVCFGVVYAAYYPHLHGAGQPLTGFYLSVITQLTIGFGDVYPTGTLRLVAAVQGIVAVVFVVLVFARVVATLPQIESLFEMAQQKKAAEQAHAPDERAES